MFRFLKMYGSGVIGISPLVLNCLSFPCFHCKILEKQFTVGLSRLRHLGFWYCAAVETWRFISRVKDLRTKGFRRLKFSGLWGFEDLELGLLGSRFRGLTSGIEVSRLS